MLILEVINVKREETWLDLFLNFPHQEKRTVIYKNLILPNSLWTSYRAYLDRKLFNTGIEHTKNSSLAITL